MTSGAEQSTATDQKVDGRLPYRVALRHLATIAVHETTRLPTKAKQVALEAVTELRAFGEAAFEPPLSPDLSEILMTQEFFERGGKEIISTSRVVDLLERIVDHGSDRSYVLPVEAKD